MGESGRNQPYRPASAAGERHLSSANCHQFPDPPPPASALVAVKSKSCRGVLKLGLIIGADIPRHAHGGPLQQQARVAGAAARPCGDRGDLGADPTAQTWTHADACDHGGFRRVACYAPDGEHWADSALGLARTEPPAEASATQAHKLLAIMLLADASTTQASFRDDVRLVERFQSNQSKTNVGHLLPHVG